MYKFYGKINRGQVSRPLYRGCPLLGGSVIRGFTVVHLRDYLTMNVMLKKIHAVGADT